MSYFAIAQPLGREDFLKLYRQVTLFSRLLFAPFGIHDQTLDLIGQKSFLETYSTTYQQVEDVLSKCVFRYHGYEDDRIIATMHKFVGQQAKDAVVRKCYTVASTPVICNLLLV